MLRVMADCAPGQFYIVVRQLSYGYADLFIQLREELCTSSAVLDKGWISNHGSRPEPPKLIYSFDCGN